MQHNLRIAAKLSKYPYRKIWDLIYLISAKKQILAEELMNYKRLKQWVLN